MYVSMLLLVMKTTPIILGFVNVYYNCGFKRMHLYVHDEGTCYSHDRRRGVKERKRSKRYDCYYSEIAVFTSKHCLQNIFWCVKYLLRNLDKPLVSTPLMLGNRESPNTQIKKNKKKINKKERISSYTRILYFQRWPL